MELVYLWVKEYKNIENQGFNFSPRFTCKYDEITKKLTIEEKKDYVSIFPPNINVTAIVGENGSGKSNIIDIISNILDCYKDTNCIHSKFAFILLLNIDNTLIGISYMNYRYVVEPCNKILIFDYYIYLANEQFIKPKVSFDNDASKKYQKENYNRFNLDMLPMIKKIANIHLSKMNFQLTTFMYIPSIIEIKRKPWINAYLIAASIHDNKNKQQDEFFHKFPTKEFQPMFENISDDFHKFLIIVFIQNLGIPDKKYFLDENILFQRLQKDKYIEITKDEFPNIFQNKKKKINMLTEKEQNLFLNYEYTIFQFDFLDLKERKYSDLSHGEQTIFGQLLNMYYYSLKNKKDLIFFLDEPDLSLHPEWQRKYLFELHNLLVKMNQKFHIVITSHSPFMISDLPKENVIFLENGKQVYPDIETFGANIHTLLSHGFFMKEGLMGEFAKNKINEVIDYLNGKDSPITDDDEAQRYIRIIGEPIVKRQLQRMLDSKKLDKIKEIDELKNQIESLQNRLDNLEKKS